MKIVLSAFASVIVVTLIFFGIQRVLRSTFNVPLVYLPSDGVVYDPEGRIDIQRSVIIGIQKPDGSWSRSSQWPALLKSRPETTFVSPEWVPPYVAQSQIISE